MKNTISITLSEKDASGVAAEMSFIGLQEELLNSRKETLEIRRVAFNRLALSLAAAEGHKISSVLSVQLSQNGPSGERTLVLTVTQPEPALPAPSQPRPQAAQAPEHPKAGAGAAGKP